MKMDKKKVILAVVLAVITVGMIGGYSFLEKSKGCGGFHHTTINKSAGFMHKILNIEPDASCRENDSGSVNLTK